MQSRTGWLIAEEYGITGDGRTVVTEKVNAVIAELSASGGGELYFPAGIYRTGTIVLQSNVVLRLGAGAVIRSTGDLKDYLPDEETEGSVFEGEENMGGALIWGRNLRNVGIVGQGMIDGNGILITAREEAPLYPEGVNHYGDDDYRFYHTRRPFTLKLYDCENVRLEGVRFVNPASWNVGMNRCRDVFCRGLDVKSRNFYNGDGLDFNSCERVFVSDCSFDCTDDCIALQSAFPGAACKNITISNCFFTTLFSGIRIGMACLGDFENITVTACTFENCLCSGLKVQQCEGGKMSNMIFRGLVMKNVARPFFFTHNQYECTAKALRASDWVMRPGKFENILLSDCIIENERAFERGGIIFDAAEGCEIGHVTVQNLSFRYVGSGTDNLAVGELAGERPEAHVYQEASWGGLFLRRCKNFVLSHLYLSDQGGASRLAMFQYCRNISLENPLGEEGGRITAADCQNVSLERGTLAEGIAIERISSSSNRDQ